MSHYLFPPLRAALLNQGASSGRVLISGDLSVDLTLTAVFESQNDIDLNSISYNWYYASNDSIIKQNSKTYTVVPSDVNKDIYVTATFVNTAGTTITVKSKPLLVESYDYAPTGGVSINSNPVIGTQMSITNTIQDKNGIPAGGFSYAWYRHNGTLLSSTSSTYTPTSSDEFFSIYVIVSYTDLFGYYHSIQSNVTNSVKKPNYAGTASLSIVGTLINGETLTANVSNLQDANGLPTNPTIQYRWLVEECSSYCYYQSIGYYSTSGNTLKLSDNEVNKKVRFQIRYYDSDGYQNTIYSPIPTTSVKDVNRTPGGSLTVSGTRTVGETLNINDSVTDANGMPNASGRTYTWYHTDTGNTIQSEAGTSGRSYALQESDKGKSIRVKLSYTDNHGYYNEFTSATIGPIAAKDYTPTGTVTISGNPTQGQTLIASDNIADQNGISTGAITYEWYYSGNSTSIGSGSSYTLTSSDIGKTLYVIASYTDNDGFSHTVTSQATSTVQEYNEPATGQISIGGTLEEGTTLTVTNTISDQDGINNSTIIYNWYRNNNVVSFGTQYTLTSDDVGSNIKLVYSFSDNKGQSYTFTSNTVGPILAKNYLPTGKVTISGTRTEGETLTASNTISDLNGISAGAITYKWYRTGTSTSIGSSSSYTLTSSDAGKTLYVIASYTDNDGFSHTVTSQTTSTIKRKDYAPTGTITISGTPIQHYTLTASSQISDTNGVGTIYYWWYRVGDVTEFEISPSITLTSREVGKQIYVEARYQDGDGYQNVFGPSSSTKTVQAFSCDFSMIYKIGFRIVSSGGFTRTQEALATGGSLTLSSGDTATVIYVRDSYNNTLNDFNLSSSSSRGKITVAVSYKVSSGCSTTYDVALT